MRELQAVPTDHRLATRLAAEIEGEVAFDRASRGRYSTDASIYQIEPVGVVIPKTQADVEIAAQIARDAGVSLLPRGGGTSQSGPDRGPVVGSGFHQAPEPGARNGYG